MDFECPSCMKIHFSNHNSIMLAKTLKSTQPDKNLLSIDLSTELNRLTAIGSYSPANKLASVIVKYLCFDGAIVMKQGAKSPFKSSFGSLVREYTF